MEAIVALGLIFGAAHAYDHYVGKEETAQAYVKPRVEIVQTLPSVGIHRYDYKKTSPATTVTWVFLN